MDWNNFSSIFISIAEGLGMILAILGSIAGLISYIAKKEFAKADDMQKIKTELHDELNLFRVRMTTIEETLKHQPTIRDIESISARIGNIAVEIARIGATTQGQTDMLRSIDQRLNKE